MQIVLATGNAGKLREMRALLPEFDVIPQSDFIQDAAAETGLTFVENAILKARHASLGTGHPTIADDSGIQVHALAGAPGIRSARYAGEHATDNDNIDALLNAMDGIENRNACFRCVVVFLRHAEDPSPLVCEGTWEGKITTVPQGDNGFGYDPVFFVPSIGKTAAELSADEKNALSHRGQALNKLKQQIHPFLKDTDDLNHGDGQTV